VAVTQVRTHTVKRGGKTYTRSQHTRKGDRAKLRPRRALANARRAHGAVKGGKKAAGALFATAAVTEILAFTVFRGVGGLLVVVGAILAVAGAGLWKRT
jgi:hypothetical protein